MDPMKFWAFVLGVVSINCENIYEGRQEAATNHSYYRRLEMAVSNFKFPFYSHIISGQQEPLCKKGARDCNLKTKVVYNHISERRDIVIDDEYEEAVGIHLFHTEVWEEPDDVKSVFSSINNLSVEIILHNKQNLGETIFNKTYENIIALYQDVERKIWIDYSQNQLTFVLNNVMKTFGIYVSYRCQGYAGINCEHDCMKDPSSIECQREIYEQTCKNGSDNATNCTSSFRCSRNENPCQNDALCIKVNRNKTYCVCPEFFRGPTCDDIYCDAPCDTRYGHCAINNKCQCTAKHKKGLYCNETVCPLNEKVCQNGGTCRVVENEMFCICDTHSYGGRKCEHACKPKCVNGVCVAVNSSKIFCFCNEGYLGDDCSMEISKMSQKMLQKYTTEIKPKAYDTSVVLIIILVVLIVILYVYDKRKDKQTFIIENKTSTSNTYE